MCIQLRVLVFPIARLEMQIELQRERAFSQRKKKQRTVAAAVSVFQATHCIAHDIRRA